MLLPLNVRRASSTLFKHLFQYWHEDDETGMFIAPSSIKLFQRILFNADFCLPEQQQSKYMYYKNLLVKNRYTPELWNLVCIIIKLTSTKFFQIMSQSSPLLNIEICREICTFFWNLKTLSLGNWYRASFSGPLPRLIRYASVVSTGHGPGFTRFTKIYMNFLTQDCSSFLPLVNNNPARSVTCFT